MRCLRIAVVAAFVLAPFSLHGSVVSAQETGGMPPSQASSRVEVNSPLKQIVVTLKHSGKTVATLAFQKDDKARLFIRSDRLTRSSSGTVTTLSGKVTLRLTRENKSVLVLTADEMILQVIQVIPEAE